VRYRFLTACVPWLRKHIGCSGGAIVSVEENKAVVRRIVAEV